MDSRNFVPCSYFARGLCVKGSTCPFLHDPVSRPPPQHQHQHPHRIAVQCSHLTRTSSHIAVHPLDPWDPRCSSFHPASLALALPPTFCQQRLSSISSGELGPALPAATQLPHPLCLTSLSLPPHRIAGHCRRRPRRHPSGAGQEAVHLLPAGAVRQGIPVPIPTRCGEQSTPPRHPCLHASQLYSRSVHAAGLAVGP